MITKDQAEDIVKATTYRDWTIETVEREELTVAMLLGHIHFEMTGKIPVRFVYSAPNSEPGKGDVENRVHVAIPLPSTEAEFARALYEVVSIIEEHERREFFRVGKSVVRDRLRDSAWTSEGWKEDGGSSALFHPHGVNRNALFHGLDAYAAGLKMEALNGTPMTADAV